MKKLKPVTKYDGTEKYVFIAGVAKVPGTNMTITIKEFNKLKEKLK